MDNDNRELFEDQSLEQDEVSEIDQYFDKYLTDDPTDLKPGEYNLEESMRRESTPTIQLVNKILLTALQENAKELRIIPLASEILVRSNQGAGFYNLLNTKLPLPLIEPLVNILRLNAGMEKLARNKPVVGKMRLLYQNTVQEAVVRTLPGPHGTSLSLSFRGA